MPPSYARQTVDAINPVVRLAHRNRVRRSVELAVAKADGGPVLDYGCGTGAFVAEMGRIHSAPVVGYEPIMEERAEDGLPIFTDLDAVRTSGPFALITLFETIEHLSTDEQLGFLTEARRLLRPAGGVLLSCPVMIGPAVFLKELNRKMVLREPFEHTPGALLRAGLFGRTSGRSANIKGTHNGFDFRQVCRFAEAQGWTTQTVAFGPLPTRTWYGNSQAYLWWAPPR